MKHLISFLFVIILSKSLIAQTCTISAKDAKRHVGKEVIVRGKLIEFGNSSYGQFAWFYLGPDTAHKQLKVLYISACGPVILSCCSSVKGDNVQLPFEA